MEEIVQQKPVQVPAEITPVLKSDPPPETKSCSPESPPQEIREFDEVTDASSEKAFEITKNVKKSNAQTLQDVRSGAPIEAKKLPPLDTENELLAQQDDHQKHVETLNKTNELLDQKINETSNDSAEDVELTALRNYIFEDGFVVATVAFHIVTLCAQPMVTPSTTTWDFVDRAMIPNMVFGLLKQPGYLEGIWPSVKIVMGSNKGNTAWCSGIVTTIAFFDIIRTLPILKDMEKSVD
jgi:hypothetical protein